jgi:prepilin-type N-terminal cleavage/methylation domain-containing protein
MNATFASRDRAGFTLIELLVTISLLSVVLLLATQVVQTARSSIRSSESRSNADAIARRVFSQIDQDLSAIVIRPDARIEFETRSGDDRIAFLTTRRGLSANGVGERGVSLVSYLHDGKDLLRGSRGHQFDDAAANALNLEPSTAFPAIPSGDQQSLSGQILRFEVEYLIKGTNTVTIETTAPKTSENLRGVIISLVALDPLGLRALDDARRRTLAAEFADAPAGGGTLERWNDRRDQLSRSGVPGIPRDVLQSIRCYQRTFLVP